MHIEDRISEYLHALTTLRLAAALNNDAAYVRRVAKRVGKNTKDKKVSKLCKNIAKTQLPISFINKVTAETIQVYTEQGYNWLEQA